MPKAFHVNEIVYHAVIQKILNKEWLPGMKISSENQLAQELGVSRTSVREAIGKLVAEGILCKRRGEGTFVRQLTSSIQLNSLIPNIMLDVFNVLEVQEFRMIFEAGSTRLCAQRCSPELIEKLQATYDTMCRVNRVSKEYAEADYEFHRLIGEGSGNSLVIKMNEIMINLLKMQQLKTNEYLGPSGGLAEHKKILEAIRERDAEIAEIYMQRHLQVTIDRIRKVALIKKEQALKDRGPSPEGAAPAGGQTLTAGQIAVPERR